MSNTWGDCYSNSRRTHPRPHVTWRVISQCGQVQLLYIPTQWPLTFSLHNLDTAQNGVPSRLNQTVARKQTNHLTTTSLPVALNENLLLFAKILAACRKYVFPVITHSFASCHYIYVILIIIIISTMSTKQRRREDDKVNLNFPSSVMFLETNCAKMPGEESHHHARNAETQKLNTCCYHLAAQFGIT